MTEELQKNTHDLIHQIEQKDRNFRIAQTLFMVFTLISLIVVISAQQRTLNGVREQLVQAKQIAAESAKHSDEQQETILRRLDCITVFFSQRDRTNLTIENIDRCTFNRDGDIEQFFITDSDDAPQTTTQQQPSSPPPQNGNQPDDGQPPAVTPPVIDVPPVVEEDSRSLLQRLGDMLGL